MSEKIVSVAVHAYGMIFSLPAPARHHHILHAMDSAGLDAVAPGPEAQGFLTNTGRFVDRLEGAAIFLRENPQNKLSWGPNLFSEDLW